MVAVKIRTIAITAASALSLGGAALGITAASAASATPTAPPPATTAGLRVWLGLGAGEAAAGSTYYPLEFTNVSGHTVTIRGFPGVSAINGSRQLGSPAGWEATVTPGSVTLAEGATAHTVLQIADVGDFGGVKSAEALALRIFPPNQRTATEIVYSFRALAVKGPVYMHVGGPIRAGVGIPGSGS